MIKSDSHDSSVEYHSHHEKLIKDDTLSRARRARRQSQTNSVTSGDETRREVSETHLRPPASRRQQRSSPKSSNLPPLSNATSVTIENETKPVRKKKTFKPREGEEVEMTVRKRSSSRQRRRQRTTSKEGQSESEATIDHGRDKILGIVIHRTDRLRTDLRLRHPFVRVHLIDLNTRSYVRKTDPNRLVLRYHIPNEHPTDYIPGISTDPYDFNANRSTIPSWEQMLIINEEYPHFTTVQQQNIFIFFEILEFVTNQQNTNDLSNTFPIAWAFLKIIGSRNTLNTERIMRLQLWQPIEHQHGSALTPDVVMWHNHMHRTKYPSTLYVTIKPLNIPTHFYPGLRSALDGGIEHMRNEYRQIKRELEEQNNPNGISEHLTDSQQMDLNNETMGPLQRVAQIPPQWKKLPNSKCKIPTESLLSLNTSERGCSSIRFSHNGHFLACAEVNKAQENNIISIFEIMHGRRVALFTGHLQMIYDLDWSRTDCYLASASADSSVKIWNFEQIQRKPWRSLAHPSYVYCVRFHPFDENIVVTAGYDKLIRIWDLKKKHGHIIRTMADHLGFISSLSFNPDGTRLASVDSVGAIKVWHGLPNETSTSQIFADSWTLGSTLDFTELQNIPLNSVTYSPGDHYLLVSARDNLIVLIDVRTKSISRRYIGSFNLQDRIRSTFSSCGSLVFSGSEDGQVHCWHTYNGNLLYSYKYINYTQPVVDIQFHPFDNILAMCSIGPLHQVYVFQHTFSEADIEAKPFQSQHNISRQGFTPTATPLVTSDTDRSFGKSRMESSGDELPRTATTTLKNESKNRRLAVVNKILDEMDDVINPKSGTSRRRDSITDYGGNHFQRDISPYQGHQNISLSGYNSDSGRPPLVSPLRNLTTPDLFVPLTNRSDENDDYMYQKSPSSTNQIMYATTNYKAQSAEELSFSKNDKIKILHKESHLSWYAEHIQTGARGYISPNRVHINAKDTYPQSQKSTITNTHSISEIPRLDNSSRRIQQKSVKFDSSD
ncbi:unnamed protein product [Adineta steineri]|uniref:SH3 domain-containing protein n=1 Tax=Adineta steineri TaxID=433720 RepID=A0A815N7H4_9BILA|nr:unnamed protein product [Adineta steineri]CAF1622541.1 unnamed protein product [Adineta steineri]